MDAPTGDAWLILRALKREWLASMPDTSTDRELLRVAPCPCGADDWLRWRVRRRYFVRCRACGHERWRDL